MKAQAKLDALYLPKTYARLNNQTVCSLVDVVAHVSSETIEQLQLSMTHASVMPVPDPKLYTSNGANLICPRLSYAYYFDPESNGLLGYSDFDVYCNVYIKPAIMPRSVRDLMVLESEAKEEEREEIRSKRQKLESEKRCEKHGLTREDAEEKDRIFWLPFRTLDGNYHALAGCSMAQIEQVYWIKLHYDSCGAEMFNII